MGLYKKHFLAASWTLAISVVALLTGLHGALAWLLVGVVALAPPFLLLYFTRELSATTSQNIHDARR